MLIFHFTLKAYLSKILFQVFNEVFIGFFLLDSSVSQECLVKHFYHQSKKDVLLSEAGNLFFEKLEHS